MFFRCLKIQETTIQLRVALTCHADFYGEHISSLDRKNNFKMFLSTVDQSCRFIFTVNFLTEKIPFKYVCPLLQTSHADFFKCIYFTGSPLFVSSLFCKRLDIYFCTEVTIKCSFLKAGCLVGFVPRNPSQFRASR